MRINCPHCRRDIEVVAEPQAVSCPSCGSRLHFLDETLVQTADVAKVIDEFELLEHVGRGHFGNVWKAHDSKLDRLVAVKIPRTRQLNETTLRFFVREARAAAKLRHDNIVAVHQVVQDKDSVYIVSDFIQGVTLAEELRFKHRSPREAAELCATIADALDYAHHNGVSAHRDVKPGNIMIDADGKPYIMDFGLAKLEAADFTMTVAGQILGTPSYMSPEEAPRIEAAHRPDVYSLGVVLYELLTRNRPFTGETRLLVQQIVNEEPRPPRRIDKSIPRNLETICLKAMSKEPERRYATAGELAADLRRFLRDEPIQARPVSTFERSWRWAKRNPVVAAASGMAALLALVLVMVLWIRSGEIKRQEEEFQASRPMVAMDTVPTGARVVFVLLDDLMRPVEEEGELVRHEERSPVTTRLLPGQYLVVAVADDGSFHEVYRQVPEPDSDEGIGGHNHDSWELRTDGTVELPTITIPNAADVIQDMTFFDGGELMMGTEELPDTPPHTRQVADFYLDQTEVTIAAYRNLDALPNSVTNRPDDEPVTMVTFDQALNFAELAGKRLMTEAEYEFAATNSGTTTFPWGDDASRVVPAIFNTQPVEQPAFDQTATVPPVYGLCSNVAEWTDTVQIPYSGGNRSYSAAYRRALTGSRVVRGLSHPDDDLSAADAPEADLLLVARRRKAISTSSRMPHVGFRCARSTQPRFIE